MATAPRAVVAAPARQAPVLSLYRSSRTVLGDLDLSAGAAARWEGGVLFEPDPCGDDIGSPTTQVCGPEDSFDAERGAGSEEYEPFLVRVADRCTPAQAVARDMRGRVTRALEIDQHYQLEREFWRGDLAVAATPDLPNRYLTDSNVQDLSPGGASPLAYALAALQEALAGCRPAGRGMIHCTTTTAALWHSKQMLRRDGALLLDVFDNIIVPGVGYDGSAPNGSIDTGGDTAYAYATGLVDSRLSPITITGLNGEEIDQATNEQIVRASRFAAAYWDGCCHFGINVDHCNTACEG